MCLRCQVELTSTVEDLIVTQKWLRPRKRKIMDNINIHWICVKTLIQKPTDHKVRITECLKYLG